MVAVKEGGGCSVHITQIEREVTHSHCAALAVHSLGNVRVRVRHTGL